jgi:hypothetical protein
LALLTVLGLVDPRTETLTEEGRTFDDAYWIDSDEALPSHILRERLLQVPATQVLMQGLHGRDAVRFSGAHHLMARHGLVDAEDGRPLRAFLSVLNGARIVAYSNKHQTVRILAPLPAGDASTIRVIEPDRPYSNVLALREILRGCEGYIWWAEPHLGRKALEPLVYEADKSRVDAIRLLSGERSMDDPTRKDFKRFRAEMEHIGITAEWRVVPPAHLDWHDRFILGRRQAWNVPPVNTMHKGDYSEASRTSHRPPFERWWSRGLSLA